MKKKIFIVIILLIAIVGWWGYKMYNEKTPDVVQKKPDVVIDAAQLVAAFDKDTAAAAKMYIDKIIEIKGNIKRIDTSGSIVLGADDSPSEVVVGIDRRHVKEIETLKAGTTAVLQGVCSGFDKASGDDLLSSLGTTVELRSAGIKNNK